MVCLLFEKEVFLECIRKQQVSVNITVQFVALSSSLLPYSHVEKEQHRTGNYFLKGKTLKELL